MENAQLREESNMISGLRVEGISCEGVGLKDLGLRV